ncbi:MAG: TolC family protein [Candidatus Wallbacteria bacterium]|nr:TolC family protein [Candidatus Wallbacteria bacterium]
MRVLVMMLFLSILFRNALAGEVKSPVVTFDGFLKNVLEHDPYTAAARKRLDAAGFKLRREGSYPELELEIEAEGFSGSGEFHGTGNMELSGGVGKVINSRRIVMSKRKAAQIEVKIAAQEVSLARSSARDSATAAFIEAQCAFLQLDLAKRAQKIADSIAAAVGEKVRAGREADVVLDKAEVGSLLAESGSAAAAVRAGESLREMSRMAGQEIFAVEGANFKRLPEIPGLDSLENFLTNAPALRILELKQSAGAAAVDLAHAEEAPPIQLSAGVSSSRGSGDQALKIAFSMPLANIGSRSAVTSAALSDQAAAACEFQAALAASKNELRCKHAIYREYAALLQKLQYKGLERGRKVYRSVEEGYRLGKYDLMTVLDGSRELMEIESAVINAYQQAVTAAAAIDSLTGHVLHNEIYSDSTTGGRP